VPPCGWVDGQLVIKSDPDLEALLSQGELMVGPVVCRSRGMEDHRCHQNISGLWLQKRKGDALVGIAIGYCFSSDDGLWHQHSWGVRRDGLLETLGERDKYFGLKMTGIAADVFAFKSLFKEKQYWGLFSPDVLGPIMAELKRSVAV
jgi:hypothetical protein